MASNFVSHQRSRRGRDALNDTQKTEINQQLWKALCSFSNYLRKVSEKITAAELNAYLAKSLQQRRYTSNDEVTREARLQQQQFSSAMKKCRFQRTTIGASALAKKLCVGFACIAVTTCHSRNAGVAEQRGTNWYCTWQSKTSIIAYHK